MTPGLSCSTAVWYEEKNAVNTNVYFCSNHCNRHCDVDADLVYSLSFGPDHGGVIGDFSWFGLEGVSLTEPYVEGRGFLTWFSACFR